MQLKGLFVLMGVFAAGAFWGHADSSLPPARAGYAAQAAAADDAQLRLARAYLKLAELDLQRALDGNQRVPALYPRTLLDSLQDTVQMARNRVEQLTAKGDRHSVYLQNAELEIRTTQERLARAQAANRQSPGAVPALELDRLTARLEMAHANLECVKSMKDAPAEELLQWRVDQLRADVLDLRNTILFSNARL
jgi:multidrug resistance efflux pump